MKYSEKIRSWLAAIRLRTLPLALASIAMGSFLAAADNKFDWTVFILASITTVFLQILSNLANDYGDSIHGADSSNRQGPKRMVQSGMINRREMKTGIYFIAIASFISGLVLLFHSFSEMNTQFAIFLFVGIGGIAAAFGYTMGRNPYGYAGLGDVFVFIFFGLVAVIGTYFLHTNQIDATIALPAISSGFLSTAVLNVNNIRDIKSDLEAGKRSIPVRLGRERAIIYHTFLLSGAFISAGLYCVIHYESIAQFLFILSMPLFIRNIREVRRKIKPDQLDPSLKKLALASLLFTILFGMGILIEL